MLITANTSNVLALLLVICQNLIHQLDHLVHSLVLLLAVAWVEIGRPLTLIRRVDFVVSAVETRCPLQQKLIALHLVLLSLRGELVVLKH